MRINLNNEDIIEKLSSLSTLTGKSPTALIYKLIRDADVNNFHIAQNKDAKENETNREHTRNALTGHLK